MYIYICIYIHIHIYIYTCIYIYMHVHTFTPSFWKVFCGYSCKPPVLPVCRARTMQGQGCHGTARLSSQFVKRSEEMRRVAVRCALCEEVTCDESVSLIGHGGMEVVQIYFPHKWTFGRCCFTVGTPLWICLSHTAIRINGLEWAWQRRHSGFSWVYVGQFLWVWHISQRDLLRLWKSVKG